MDSMSGGAVKGGRQGQKKRADLYRSIDGESGSGFLAFRCAVGFGFYQADSRFQPAQLLRLRSPFTALQVSA